MCGKDKIKDLKDFMVYSNYGYFIPIIGIYLGILKVLDKIKL